MTRLTLSIALTYQYHNYYRLYLSTYWRYYSPVFNETALTFHLIYYLTGVHHEPISF